MFCMHWIDLRVAGLVWVVLLAIAAPAAADTLPEEFLGKFRGSVTGSVGDVEGDFNMASSIKSDGFTMSWSPNNSAEFEMSERKRMSSRPIPGGSLSKASRPFGPACRTASCWSIRCRSVPTAGTIFTHSSMPRRQTVWN